MSEIVESVQKEGGWELLDYVSKDHYTWDYTDQASFHCWRRQTSLTKAVLQGYKELNLVYVWQGSQVQGSIIVPPSFWGSSDINIVVTARGIKYFDSTNVTPNIGALAAISGSYCLDAYDYTKTTKDIACYLYGRK